MPCRAEPFHEDVFRWAETYNGPPLHALLSDPPYELGFMGSNWDNTGIAFSSKTWSALSHHLLPGAFGMAFASSRGWHRMAVAIEDAGLVIHPSIFGWGFAQGFPKATRIDVPGEVWGGYRYGMQAIKPALEPIIVFQKPYEGSPVDSIDKTGAGAFNVDGVRIGMSAEDAERISKGGGFLIKGYQPVPGVALHLSVNPLSKNADYDVSKGRWPANLVLQHADSCKMVGIKNVDAGMGFINKKKEHVERAMFKDLHNDGNDRSYRDEAGKEVVSVWECDPGCPVASLGDSARFFLNGDWMLERLEAADAVLYVPKASTAERQAGLEKEHRYRQNLHPTVKPLKLTSWLAKLLLPPVEYAPRRLLVPFAGSGSEMIGAVMSGWEEIVGVERDSMFVDIAKKRIEYWRKKEPVKP